MSFNKTGANGRQEQGDFARNFTKIYTDSENSFDLAYRFAKEFFYDLMFDEKKSNENAIVIRDAANDLVYEMKDFSKDNAGIEFTMETIDKYKGRSYSILKIKDGEIVSNEKVEHKKGNQKNNHLRGGRRTRQDDTKKGSEVKGSEEQVEKSSPVVKKRTVKKKPNTSTES